MQNKPFECDYIQLCEYYSRDSFGRSLAIGVFDGEVRLAVKPKKWPPINFNIVIIPNEMEFTLGLDFQDPVGENLFKSEFSYKALTKPERVNRFVIAIQVPPVQFTHFGDYTIKLLSKKRNVYQKVIPVNLGEAEPFQADVSASFQLGASYASNDLEIQVR